MKKIFVSSFALAGALFLGSCSSNKLVGNWKVESQKGTTYEFYDNGTGALYEGEKVKVSFEYEKSSNNKYALDFAEDKYDTSLLVAGEDKLFVVTDTLGEQLELQKVVMPKESDFLGSWKLDNDTHISVSFFFPDGTLKIVSKTKRFGDKAKAKTVMGAWSLSRSGYIIVGKEPGDVGRYLEVRQGKLHALAMPNGRGGEVLTRYQGDVDFIESL